MAADIPLRPLGATGEMVSALGLGGYHIGKMQRASRSGPHRPCGDRCRHHVHGQRLGIPRGPVRDAHGQAIADRRERCS